MYKDCCSLKILTLKKNWMHMITAILIMINAIPSTYCRNSKDNKYLYTTRKYWSILINMTKK